MPTYELIAPRPLGPGTIGAQGSVHDPEFAALFRAYKARIAGTYSAVSPDELERIPPGGGWASPKIDGELWFLVVDAGEVFLASPTGRVICGGLPVLAEAQALLARVVPGRTILVGELFAAVKKGRPRVSDVARVLGGGAEAEVDRLGFQVYDWIAGGDPTQPEPPVEYAAKLEGLLRIVPAGKRLRVVPTEVVETTAELLERFCEWADGGKAEGVVLRSRAGRIYKIKPFFTVDAVVLGYTDRTEDPEQARTLLVGLMRPGGAFQIVGMCGNLGSEDNRRALRALLAPREAPCTYRHASSSGEMFRFLRPELVIEIRAADVLVEDAYSRPIRSMVLSYDGKEWTPLGMMPSATLLFPVLVRQREDKQVDETDVRFAQLLERVHLERAEDPRRPGEVPRSEIVRREVYTKLNKGSLAVRKLVLWRTHKAELDLGYPAYVVAFTDYSAGRKTPLEREIRLAPDLETAQAIAEKMLEDNVKKGWERAV